MIIPNLPERMVFPVGTTYRLYLICKKKKHEIIRVHHRCSHHTQVCYGPSAAQICPYILSSLHCAVFRHLHFFNICFKQIFVSGESDFVCILVCSTVTVSLFQTGCGEGLSELVNERIVTIHYSLFLLNSQVTYYGSVSK